MAKRCGVRIHRVRRKYQIRGVIVEVETPRESAARSLSGLCVRLLYYLSLHRWLCKLCTKHT